MAKIINETPRKSLNAKPLNLNYNKLRESEVKDEILSFAIKYLGEFITNSTISEKVFDKDNKEEISYLMTQMKNEIPEFAEFRESRYNVFIKTNKLTENFLSNGGFSKIEKEKIESEQKIADRELKQDKLLDLDLKLSSFENRIGRKLIIAGFIITFLSFIITVLTIEYWLVDDNENEKVIQTIKQEKKMTENILKDTLK